MTTSCACSTAFRSAPALAALLAFSATAQVRLDRLTACDDIGDVYRTVESGRASDSGCGVPATPLDATLVRVAGDAVHLCFEKWPQPVLQGFSCVIDADSPANVLVCMRPARLADLQAYKVAHDASGGAAGAEYGSKARACPLYHGDVGPAQPTLMPPLLATIARFDFGFIARLGEGEPAGAYVTHGFAYVDPSLDDAPDAVEFVYLLTGGVVADVVGKREPAGRRWWLSVDPADAADALMADRTRSLPTAFMVDYTDFKVRQRYDAPAGQSLDAAVDALFGRVVDGLEIEGFEDTGADPTGGASIADMLAKVLPYGLRPRTGASESPRIAAMGRFAPSICAGGGEAGYIALVVGSGSTAGFDRDEGSVGLAIGAFGKCPEFVGPVRAYVTQLGKDAEFAVREFLGND
jgi:hypothetical protein